MSEEPVPIRSLSSGVHRVEAVRLEDHERDSDAVLIGVDPGVIEIVTWSRVGLQESLDLLQNDQRRALVEAAVLTGESYSQQAYLTKSGRDRQGAHEAARASRGGYKEGARRPLMPMCLTLMPSRELKPTRCWARSCTTSSAAA